VSVERVRSDQWSVGIRGFSSPLSKSMLVLIDGRSVETPLFGGVYWEVQDTLLEDVDRIEVVRGPGGTLWGANAVNGVVNLVTKSARETHGLLVDLGGGSEERAFGSVRYGGSLGGSADYRVYARYFDRGASFHAGGADFDPWHMAQSGFRADWETRPGEAVTIQGDLYRGRAGQIVAVTTYDPPYIRADDTPARLSGANVLGRWGRRFSEGSILTGRSTTTGPTASSPLSASGATRSTSTSSTR
jgi:iron complex outermembrane receptor protein